MATNLPGRADTGGGASLLKVSVMCWFYRRKRVISPDCNTGGGALDAGIFSVEIVLYLLVISVTFQMVEYKYRF